MKSVKNLQYFTAITFFFLSILFTVTSSAVSINFNLNSSKNVFSYLELFSSIINGNILSISYAQAYGTSEEVELELELEEEQQVEVEEEKEEEVEEEKEEIEKGEDDNEVINHPQTDFVTPFELKNTNDDNNDVETELTESSSSITDGGIEEITSKKILQQPSDNIAAIGNGIDAQASVMGTPESDTPPPPGGDTPPPGGDTPPPPECPPGSDPNDPTKCPPDLPEDPCPEGYFINQTINKCQEKSSPPSPPPSQPPPPTPPTPPTPPEEQSDLLVYENPELGFKIDYPSNWTKAGN
ncbi:MAG TPA: hypothetical protein VFC05_02970, partial [Nitrososphaeraceae archaeon]|nr:hypothetical protein [Nitrososphaeraceae archaeon]